jgi:hypothetical protein
MRNYQRLMGVAGLLLGLAGMAAGQDAKGQEGKGQDPNKSARRLETITWNPVDHKLTWTVTKGTLDSGKFQSKEKTTYEINMDSATMTLNGEGRRFSKREAVSVHALMDLVAKYAAESTMWWDAGHGDPVDGSGDQQKVDGEGPFLPEHPGRSRPGTRSIPISTEKPQLPVVRIVSRTIE